MPPDAPRDIPALEGAAALRDHPRRGLASAPAVLWMLVQLAWRNLLRNRVRSALTAGAMVVALTLMIAYLALMEGMVRQMISFATDITLGHIQVHREEYVENQDLYALVPWRLMKHLEETTPYRYAPRLYAAGLASAGDSSAGALLEGIDPEREPKVTELNRHVRKGRFDLEQVGQAYPHGPDGPAVTVYPVTVGFQLARNLELKVGSELVLITQAADGSIGNGLFRVAGVMEPVEPAFDRMGVVMSLAAFNSVMFLEGGAHELAVRVPDVASLDADRDRIAAETIACNCLEIERGGVTSDEGGPVVVRTWRQINPALQDMLVSSQTLIYVIGILVFAIAAMGIVNTLLMATYERRHELAILLALGMGRGSMMAMVLLEALFLGVLASIVGAVTGSALAFYLQVSGFDYSRWLPEGMDFLGVTLEPVFYGHLEPRQVVISMGMTLITALAAALVPSWRTARLRPAAALHS